MKMNVTLPSLFFDARASAAFRAAFFISCAISGGYSMFVPSGGSRYESLGGSLLEIK